MEPGTIVSVSPPKPKFAVPPVYGQPQEMVVDLVVRVGDVNNNYQGLPAMADIADFGVNTQIVISATKEAINNEIAAMKQKSSDVINSVDYHKSVIEGCNKMLLDLNPEYAEKQQQQSEINDLKRQMAELIELNKSLIEKVGSQSVHNSQKQKQ